MSYTKSSNSSSGHIAVPLDLRNSSQFPSQSQSHIANDGQAISKSWRLRSWCRALSGAYDQIFITVWQLRSCFCAAPSLTGGRGCLLYMLLAWKSRPYITVSVLRLPFLSPPTTHRVTVEVFDPASTRVGFASLNSSQSQSYFTTGGLPPISLSWCQAIETRDQNSPPPLNWALAILVLT
jgi:hypothetical protein